MELIEVAAEELNISQEDFIRSYADIEAYTSCDDEGDDFHECDFFKDYIGPTKWVHLTNKARDSSSIINDIHYSIWKDVWSHPTCAVDLADKVSKDCLRYYKEFMLEPRTTMSTRSISTESTEDNPTSSNNNMPLVRVKVIPASFGLEGFEDAIWEATEGYLMEHATAAAAAAGCPENDEDDISSNTSTGASSTTPGAASTSTKSSGNSSCKAITFVVAAPDLFTDPLLLEDKERVAGTRSGTDTTNMNDKDHAYSISASPQIEFEPDRFHDFALTLREKMELYSKMEQDDKNSLLLENVIELTPFHPLWKMEMSEGKKSGNAQGNGSSDSISGVELDGRKACNKKPFPYPCVAVSTEF